MQERIMQYLDTAASCMPQQESAALQCIRMVQTLCTSRCDLGRNKTNQTSPFPFCRPVFVPSRDMTEVMISSTPMEDMRLSPSKDRLSFQVGCTKAATSCVALFMLTLACTAINNKQTAWISCVTGNLIKLATVVAN